MFSEAEQNLDTISDLFITASTTESFFVPGAQQCRRRIGLFAPRNPNVKRKRTSFPDQGQNGA